MAQPPWPAPMAAASQARTSWQSPASKVNMSPRSRPSSAPDRASAKPIYGGTGLPTGAVSIARQVNRARSLLDHDATGYLTGIGHISALISHATVSKAGVNE